MHFDEPAVTGAVAARSGPWHRELTRYHWFVLIVAALGWLFDTMDQQLFNLARVPAMRELLAAESGAPASDAVVAEYGGYATSIFLIGWATGGLGFGVLGDRIGRAKTMLLTILMYSFFTGLSALAWDFWSFAAFRFLTGLGVGGEFAVGVALVAEVMPERARPFALGLLQALSAIGNIAAAVISITFGRLEETGAIGSAWRGMFLVGALPALLAIVIRRRLKEPRRWQAVSAEGGLERRLGSYAELFGNPRWRKNAIVGMLLAFSGVVGLWGIGHGAAGGVCGLVFAGASEHRDGVLVPGRLQSDFLDDSPDGLLSTGTVRRLRGLLSRTVSDAPAEHGDVVLL